MNRKVVKVLLVGESAMGFSILSKHLEKHGGICRSASSYAEAAQLFSERPFDLVLCSDRITGIHILLSALTGSSASLFCSHSVEASCWWVPAVLHGEKCLGVSALRPNEFAKLLDQMMDEPASPECVHAVAAPS